MITESRRSLTDAFRAAEPLFARPDVFARIRSDRRVRRETRQRRRRRVRAPADSIARDTALDPARDHGLGRRSRPTSGRSRPTRWPGAPTRPTCSRSASLDAIASGRAYAKLLDAATRRPARFDAVMKSPQRDDGDGVPYQVQYALRPAGRRERALDRGHRPLVRRPRRQAGARARHRPRHQRAARRRRSSSPICRASMGSPAR